MLRRIRPFTRDQSGKLHWNPAKRGVQAFSLVPTNLPAGAVAVVMGAGAASPPIAFTNSQDGPFEACELAMPKLLNALVTVSLYDEGSKKLLMPRNIHVNTVFGDNIVSGLVGYVPYEFPEPFYVPPLRSIVANFLDGAAGNTLWPVINGVKWYDWAALQKEERLHIERLKGRSALSIPYFLPVDAAGAPGFDAVFLAAIGDIQLGSAIIPPGTIFELFKITYQCAGDFTVIVRDGQSGRQLSNGAVHCRALGGTPGIAWRAKEPTAFEENTILSFTFTNLVAVANIVYMTLCGRLVYLT